MGSVSHQSPAEGEPRPNTKRTRASETAIRAALKAIQSAGLPVEKVCVSGGSIEIHCGQIEPGAAPKKDDGLEQW